MQATAQVFLDYAQFTFLLMQRLLVIDLYLGYYWCYGQTLVAWQLLGKERKAAERISATPPEILDLVGVSRPIIDISHGWHRVSVRFTCLVDWFCWLLLPHLVSCHFSARIIVMVQSQLLQPVFNSTQRSYWTNNIAYKAYNAVFWGLWFFTNCCHHGFIFYSFSLQMVSLSFLLGRSLSWVNKEMICACNLCKVGADRCQCELTLRYL